MKDHQKEKSAGKELMSGGFFIKTLWIISAVALVLRLVASWEMLLAADGINNVLTPLPTSDLATYMRLGRECAEGNFPQPFYYQPWYYAVFLVLCNWIGGSSVYMVIGIQAVLSALTVFLTGWCGKKIFSEKAGLIAAGICAVSSSLILYVPFHQNETLQTFHLIGLLALTLIALEKRKAWLWGLTGTGAGIAILTRGNIWLIIPVIIIGMICSGRKNSLSWKQLSIHGICFLAAMIMIQLPFIISNTSFMGEFTGPSTAANAVLALGNSPEAPAGGREPNSTAGMMTYPESYHRMMANTSGINARSVMRQMWEWFCQDPAAFLELQFRKALLFWDGREIPNNVSLIYDGIEASAVLRYLFIGRNAVIFALGVAGIICFLPEIWRDKDVKLLTLYGFTFMFYVAVVVFYILSRFKAPVIPMLAVFAGGAVARWIILWKESPRENRLAASGRILIFVLVGVWFSSAAYDTYRKCEPAVNRWLYPDGIKLDMNGENIQYFDYGPFPFGGWSYSKLEKGTTLTKEFALLKDHNWIQLGFLLRSYEPVQVKMLVNGVLHEYSFPAVLPGKSDRRMVRLNSSLINGKVDIHIVEISGGELFAIYDIQRCYGRSAKDGQLLDGEWIIRAVTAR